MSTNRVRNLVPPVYALLILGGFLISATAGIVVIIVGGALSGLLWSQLGRGGSPATVTRARDDRDDREDREDRAAARAARRADRR